MPDLWLDVDAALSEVPVNILSLIDDTDFKTRETAIAYNAAGMDLVWNFVTTAGAMTQTAVTPTTAGDYDWAHQGDGMYSIEIPASGGASINNNTEGFGWFSGLVTGVLPWRGPTIGFRAAGLNNALIDSAYSATRGLAGTALPDAVAEAAGGLYTRGTGAGQINQAANGQVDANAVAISDDATAADNLELMYDGTGYTDDTAPASRAQVGNLSVGSGGISTVSESFTKAGAEPETNTYTATHQLDLTYHIVEDDGGATDVYYQFDIGGSGVPQSVEWTGYAQSNGDSYTVWFYNWGATAFEQVGTLDGSNGTSPVTEQFTATTAHVGTGANLGKVRLRFLSADGTAIATDRILCTYAVVQNALGFVGGAVWVDTANGESGTATGIGTVSRPSSNIEDAKTIADANNLKVFHFLPASNDDLSESMDGYEFIGAAYAIGLGGQSIDGTVFRNADITGNGEATTTPPAFEDCKIGAATIPPAIMVRCGIGEGGGTFTAAVGSGEYLFVDCVSLIAGSGSPTFDFTPVTGATGISNRRWAGGTTYTLDSNCTLSHEVTAGGGTTITTGGANVEVRGITRALTVTMSAAETVQFVGITGPITLNGTTTATVNLRGLSGTVTDNTSAATVSDLTVSQATILSSITDDDTKLDGSAINAIMADWTDSGRLDLILDARAAETTIGTPADTDIATDIANAAAASSGLTQMSESYAANGVAPTRDQCLFAIHQFLMQHGISGTNWTVKKLDNATTAFVVTLDDATTPTSAERQ